jgi:hypothetical protein
MSLELETGLGSYALQREHSLFIGTFLIPISALSIIPALQRECDEVWAKTLETMYSDGADVRRDEPLECVVPLDQKEVMEGWLKGQDALKFNQPHIGDLLLIQLPNLSFPVVKGQHRLKAYCKVREEDGLPKDAPHADCLCVKLYYSGVSQWSSKPQLYSQM